MLPIGAYDVIVGMDWLSSFNPMQIHWQDKWLLIPYNGQWMLLQGIDSDLPDKLVLQVYQVASETEALSATEPLHPQIQAILDRYPEVLQPPTELPPSRPCNHAIPLIPGAQPVLIRPYRYPPALKDEIEKQISDMLSQGLIRPSSSLFPLLYSLLRRRMGPIASVSTSANLMLLLLSQSSRSLFLIS